MSLENQSLFVRYLDFYGMDIKLNFKGESQIKSLFGAIVGLTSILCILAIGLYFFILLIQKKEVGVIYKQDETISPRTNLTEIPISFVLGDISGRFIPPNGIYEFVVHYNKFTNFEYNGKNFLNMSTEIIPYKNCEKSDLNGYDDYYEKINFDDWYCIKPRMNNLTIFNTFGDNARGFSMLQIYLLKCKNTSQFNNCKSEAEINRVLENSKIAFSHISNRVNHYNYESPNEKKLEASILGVSPFLTKKYYYYLEQTLYETDYGQIFQSQKIEDFFKFDQYQIDIEVGEARNPIGQNFISLISIRNSYFVSYYFRNYPKLQFLMAYLGGMIKFVMFFGNNLVYFLTNYYTKEKISNVIFDFSNVSSSRMNSEVELKNEKKINSKSNEIHKFRSNILK